MTVIADKIKDFNALTAALAGQKGSIVDAPLPHTCIVRPKSAWASGSKSIGLTYMAIVHGNEVGGLECMLRVMRHLLFRNGQVQVPLAFVLGNPEAALADKRFLEKDLNRSFASTGSAPEEKRAQALGDQILSRTAYLLDIHQTIEPSVQPFFIFPYDNRAYLSARQIHKDQAMVTHWGAGFSKDGMCTDAFTTQEGGVGMTMELGQKGYEETQVNLGVNAMLQAEQVAITNHNQNLGSAEFKWQLHDTMQNDLNMFTWAHTEMYPGGDVKLDEGLYNFRAMQAGEKIGTVDGRELKCAADGLMMFPKYVRDPKLPRPAELYRILRHVTPEEKVQLQNS